MLLVFETWCGCVSDCMSLTIFSNLLLFLQTVVIPKIATEQFSSPKQAVTARAMTRACPVTWENSTMTDRRTKEEKDVTIPTICRWEEVCEMVFNFLELLWCHADNNDHSRTNIKCIIIAMNHFTNVHVSLKALGADLASSGSYTFLVWFSNTSMPRMDFRVCIGFRHTHWNPLSMM